MHYGTQALFEVARWMQKPELNTKGSFTMLDSLSSGGCKGGINRLLCQAGGATPVVLVVSRQTQRASQTPDSRPALRKCLLFGKENTPPRRQEVWNVCRPDLTFNQRTCTALWGDRGARCIRIFHQNWGRLSPQYPYNGAGRVTFHINVRGCYHSWKKKINNTLYVGKSFNAD